MRRLRSETIVNGAAEGLHVEIRAGSRCEPESNGAAHRLALDLGILRQRIVGGDIARDALEAPAGEAAEIGLDLARDGGYLGFARAAGQLYIAADGLDLDALRRGRR